MFDTNLPFCNGIAKCSLVCMIVMLFSMNGCNSVTDGNVHGRRAVSSLMDSAELAMDDYPEYADSLMRLIDYNSIRSKEQRARYALLFTATEYKSYQPFNSDTLIMEAVKYYSINKNIDYRFLSYYYLGCVYMEMGQNTDAAVAFAQAEQFVDLIDNDYWKGLLYSQLGQIFVVDCNYRRAELFFVLADSCFDKAGKELHKLYALCDIGLTKKNMHDYVSADSIFHIVENMATMIGNDIMYDVGIYNSFYSLVYMNELSKATEIVNSSSLFDISTDKSFSFKLLLALYYNKIGDIYKSDYYLDQAWNSDYYETDSIYLYYVSSVIAKNKGEIELAMAYFEKYISSQNENIKTLLNQPISIVQRDYYRTATELETIKSRNRVTLLFTSIIISFLVISFIILVNLYKSRKTQHEIRDYLETIDDLTTQVSINKGKIITLNTQVREMLRQQFTPSDYLYTRYYEQIDDNKKAERLYRVLKSQIDNFTSTKNINRIDELLNNTYNGLMYRLLLSGLELKDKDLLILRFVLAGFSAKSIATLLGETHQNITQRKKRMLDKIGRSAPELMEELHIALNSK